MRRIKLVVAYDGTNYHGWQIQPNKITVEEVVNRELSHLFGEPIKVIGASRTDSGVHSFGNVAVFDTVARIPAEKVCYALNQRLPEDIRIQSSMEVPLDFHPRHCNSKKTYRYSILNCTIPMPTQRLYSHFFYVPFDIEKMQEATKHLIGTHDFKSFCSSKTTVEDTVRTIYDLKVSKTDHMVDIVVTGSGFLYNMVRIIAGTLMQVGIGAMKPEDMVSILEKCDRSSAGPTAPAKGLTLVKIEYEEELG